MRQLLILLRISLIFSVCLFTLNVVAQSDTITELEAKLAATEGPERFSLLLSLAEATLSDTPEQAVKYAEQAVALSRKEAWRPDDARSFIVLGRAHHELSNYEAALSAHQEAIQIGKLIGAHAIVAEAMVRTSMAYWRLGDYNKALSFTLEALEIEETLDDPKSKAAALHNTAIVYDLLGQFETALDYHDQALTIRRKINDVEGIGSTFKNIGNVYFFKGDFENAREYYLKARDIYQTLGDKGGMAGALNNIGYATRYMGDPAGALEYCQQALALYQATGNQYEIANVYHNLGQSQTDLKQFKAARESLDKALKTAEAIDAKALIQENHELQSTLYAAQDDYKKALDSYKKAVEVKDALFNEEQAKQIASLQTKYETDKQQRELELLKKSSELQELALESEEMIRWALMVGLIFLILAAFLIYNRYRIQKHAHEQLAEAHKKLEQAHGQISIEKDKADKLLLNILPIRVANDLKERNQTEPESFENVTVYFSDVVGFTTLSTDLEPKFLIDELNDIFTAFDNIIEHNHCERIKTIGDAYLCVCGMPDENENHAENVVRSALEIVEYLEERNSRSTMQWEIRIGIHTGRVVGGVVGIKKYIYDVFGDTINTAARMESNSDPMRINISETTYHLVKHLFDVSPRGSMPVKGKGDMNMYFVERAKSLVN